MCLVLAQACLHVHPGRTSLHIFLTGLLGWVKSLLGHSRTWPPSISLPESLANEAPTQELLGRIAALTTQAASALKWTTRKPEVDLKTCQSIDMGMGIRAFFLTARANEC